MQYTPKYAVAYNIPPDQWGYAGAQKALAESVEAGLGRVEAGAVAYADVVGQEAHAYTDRAAAKLAADEAIGRMMAVWDGPIHEGTAAPQDKTALWINGSEVKQWVETATPAGVTANWARNTATVSTTGWAVNGVDGLRVEATSDPARGRLIAKTQPGQSPNMRIGETVAHRVPLAGWSGSVNVSITVGTTAPGLRSYIRIWWYNETSADPFWSTNGSGVAVTRDGVRLTATAAIRDGATHMGVSVLTTGDPGGVYDWWITQAQIGTTTAYVDGDTPGYNWSGGRGTSTTVTAAPAWDRVWKASDLVRMTSGPSPEDAALLAAAHDGPTVVADSAPTDRAALWVRRDGTAQQWVDGKDPGVTYNHARQTGTVTVTGWDAPAASGPLEVAGGMVQAPFISAATPQFQMVSTAHATPVTPGQAVTIAADVGTSVSAATRWAMRLVWRDAAGGILSASTGSGQPMPASLSMRVSLTATAPTGAALATWTVLGTGALGVAATVRTGRVSVTLDGSTAYVDGATPGYRWSGAPGASTTVGAPSGWHTVTDVDSLIHRRQRGGGGSGGGGSRPLWDTHTGDMHAVAEQKLRARRGGTIGVGTTTQVIAIRWDHGAQEALDMGILDACDRLDLPYTMCLNAEPDIPAEKPIPWDDVRRLVAGGGMEVNNHSLTHSPDAPTESEQQAQIIDGLRKLQARVPDQAIDVWTQPGLYDTQYNGYNAGDDPLRYVDTVAGRMIYAHHGFCTGATPGRYVPLDGSIPTGMQTVIVDTNTAGNVQANLNRLWSLSPRGRTVVALHPERCTRDPLGSFQPASEIIKWLEWIAAERDAGRVEVLTHAGMAIADAGTHRQALLTATGAVPAGTAKSWQAGTTALATFMPAVLGAMWQAKAVLSSPTGGDVTVTATCGAATATKTVTLQPNKPATVRRHLTLPLGTTSDIPTVTITAGAGAVTVTDLRLQAV